MQVYVNKGGQQFGPFTVEQLRQYVRQGNFTTSDHACHDGQNWITVAQVPGFAATVQSGSAKPSSRIRENRASAVSGAKRRPVVTSQIQVKAKKGSHLLWYAIGGLVLLLAGLSIWLLQTGESNARKAEELRMAGREGLEQLRNEAIEISDVDDHTAMWEKTFQAVSKAKDQLHELESDEEVAAQKEVVSEMERLLELINQIEVASLVPSRAMLEIRRREILHERELEDIVLNAEIERMKRMEFKLQLMQKRLDIKKARLLSDEEEERKLQALRAQVRLRMQETFVEKDTE